MINYNSFYLSSVQASIDDENFIQTNYRQHDI